MSVSSQMLVCPPCPCSSPAAAGGQLVAWLLVGKRWARGCLLIHLGDALAAWRGELRRAVG